MRKAKLLIGATLLLISMLLGLVMPSQVLAEQKSPGCYINDWLAPTNTYRLVSDAGCNLTKSLNADFQPQGSACYVIKEQGPTYTKVEQINQCDTTKGTSAVVSTKPQIPAGCPGSKLAGPPAPGVCEQIPPGCPGATQQGPRAPGVDCPYAADGTGSTPTPTSTAKQPGCYVRDATDWQPYDCNALSAIWRDFTPTTGKCYFSWGTGFGPTRPVDIDCNNPPAKDAPIQTSAPTGTGGVTGNRADAVNCDGSTPDKLRGCVQSNPLVQQFNQIINFLGIGVGVIVLIMIIIGGIQYSTAGSNPQLVGAAKKKILNAVIALVAFLLLYSFMQWLIPGGPF